MDWFAPLIGSTALVTFFILFYLVTRYRRCPSDRILVVYGRVGKNRASICIHGGAKLITPVIQDYSYLSLTPITISIPLQNALSLQNIRVNVPSTFTVGISTEPTIMNNAAERLLGLDAHTIEEMAKEIIFGQLRLTVASLTIEQINQDRESFLELIRKNVEPELNKIGLYLINVNITDITDESEYINALGKKAAAEAVNQALVDVAVQEKTGAIGQAEATREKEVRVAQSMAEADKGRKAAEADRRVFIQQQETLAAIGEAKSNREREIKIAENEAESQKGKKTAEANRRIHIQAQEAEAIAGENAAKAKIAASESELDVKQAVALQRAEVARRQAEQEIQKAQYLTEQERLKASEIAPKEIERQKIEIAAEAEAERTRREARGQADAILARYQAEAEGIQQMLDSKAKGYASLVESCGGDAKAAATLLLIEKMEEIVGKQVEAISNLKIDKITVWDSGHGNGDSSTANFVSSLVKCLPPMQELAEMAGVQLPDYLGQLSPSSEGKDTKSALTDTSPSTHAGG